MSAGRVSVVVDPGKKRSHRGIGLTIDMKANRKHDGAAGFLTHVFPTSFRLHHSRRRDSIHVSNLPGPVHRRDRPREDGPRPAAPNATGSTVMPYRGGVIAPTSTDRPKAFGGRAKGKSGRYGNALERRDHPRNSGKLASLRRTIVGKEPLAVGRQISRMSVLNSSFISFVVCHDSFITTMNRSGTENDVQIT